MQRIILVNGSRLLHDIFRIVMYKMDGLQVIREIIDHQELPSAIEDLEAEWLVMSLPFEKGIPSWVDQYIQSHPSVRFLAVSTDSSKIKLKWLEPREEDLDDLSLNDLIHVLANKPMQTYQTSKQES